jgi:hypothetical protein
VTLTPVLSRTPTNTPRTIGAAITAFGVARADGRVVPPLPSDSSSPPIFLRPASGFLIYVEAKPGVSGRSVGLDTFDTDPGDPNILPDLQIVSSRPLGDGSAAVCDIGPPNTSTAGGVPAVDPPQFGGGQTVSNAINDLSCRFEARIASSLACTRDGFSQIESFVAAGSTIQFCTNPGVGAELAFPPGDTHLMVRIRDVAGQPGPPASIVIRVLAP